MVTLVRRSSPPQLEIQARRRERTAVQLLPSNSRSSLRRVVAKVERAIVNLRRRRRRRRRKEGEEEG